MRKSANQNLPEVQACSAEDARLAELRRIRWMAAQIIQGLESPSRRQGDNEEHRRRRIQIIRMYAGIGQRPLLQREIAARLGITRQRVQHVLAQAGLDRSARLTAKFLRVFGRRMKQHLAAAGYRQCTGCGVVQHAAEMSARHLGAWKAFCKSCYAAQMRNYRKTGQYRRIGGSEND